MVNSDGGLLGGEVNLDGKITKKDTSYNRILRGIDRIGTTLPLLSSQLPSCRYV